MKKNKVNSFDEQMRVSPDPGTGLTSSEVAARMEAGAHNVPPAKTTRSIYEIIRDNTLTLFNVLNLCLAVLVVAVGHYRNALFFIVAVCNTLISIFQEVRAKLAVDRLAIVARGKVRVVRDGAEAEIEQEKLVLDDIMCVSAGNQICADGVVVEGDGLEADESLLTGESDYIGKAVNDEVLSGSFVASGSAKIRVMKVGGENYAAKLAQEAGREKKPKSELTRTLNRVIKILTFAIIPIGLALFLAKYLGADRPAGIPWTESAALDVAVLSATAAMVGMIPEGLMLLTGVAFAVSAVNLSKYNTLVQSMPAIETLARVSVVCLDKTGTITDGTMTVTDVVPKNNTPPDEIEKAMAALLSAVSDNNETNKALRAHFPAQSDMKPTAVVPFSSARKWSGAVFGDYSYIIGAPEFMHCGEPEEIEQYAKQGMRVLALAGYEGVVTKDALPDGLTCLCYIIISDNIRPEAPETLAFFAEQQVELKVISGDNPITVSSIAMRAGLANADKFIDMSKVPDDAPFAQIAAENTVFGRVSPYQKRRLVEELKNAGQTVAMTGDGVNDVLALREADCAIAMASGSDAARSVSDFVLLTSNFGAMINVVREGRRVVNNIERVASLYLVKTIYSALLSVIYLFVPSNYPMVPIQQTPINALTVGIPSFFLALTPDFKPISGRFFDKVFQNALPAALTVVINIIACELFGKLMGFEFSKTSTLCAYLTGAAGFALLIRVSWPLTKGRVIMIILLMAVFASGFHYAGQFFSFERFWELYLTALFVPAIGLCYLMINVISLGIAAIQNRMRPSQPGGSSGGQP